jgi:nicotinamide riboside kinase
MQSLIECQVQMERSNHFIVDGSLFRLLAYSRITNLLIQDEFILNNSRYDVLFYCPIEFEFVDNGFRYEKHREEVDLELRKILSQHYFGRLVELKGSVENRLDKIKKIVAEFD